MVDPHISEDERSSMHDMVGLRKMELGKFSKIILVYLYRKHFIQTK